jgi:hypothetical protein
MNPPRAFLRIPFARMSRQFVFQRIDNISVIPELEPYAAAIVVRDDAKYVFHRRTSLAYRIALRP